MPSTEECPDDEHPSPAPPLILPPPPPEWVERLGDSYPRGNVHRTDRGCRPITKAAADRLPRGKRGHREGLLYDPSQPGCDPREWQVVVSEKELVRRLLFAPEFKGEPPMVLDMHRAPSSTDARLVDDTEFLVDVHGLVREGMDVGGMVGIGRQ